MRDATSTAFVYVCALMCVLTCFGRSGGQRGASVDSLRGTNGADFESGASVERCGGEGLSFSFFGGSSVSKNTALSLCLAISCLSQKKTEEKGLMDASLVFLSLYTHAPNTLLLLLDGQECVCHD